MRFFQSSSFEGCCGLGFKSKRLALNSTKLTLRHNRSAPKRGTSFLCERTLQSLFSFHTLLGVSFSGGYRFHSGWWYSSNATLPESARFMRPSFGVPPLPRSRSERVEEEEGKTFLSLYSFFFLLALLLLLSVVAFVFITCESAIVLIFIVFSFLVKKISSRIKSTPFALFCFLSLCSRMTSSCRSSARLSFISRIFTCSSRKRLCPFNGLSAGNFSGFRALSCAFAGHGTCNSIAFFRNSASFRKENSGFCHLFVFSNFRGSIACGSFERCCWNFCDALRYIIGTLLLLLLLSILY